MRYVPISCEQRDAMLAAVGASDVGELFDSVPASVRLDRPLDIAAGLTELELDAHMRALAGRNRPASGLTSFAGAGCYDHYVPAVVDHVLRKPEFFTAYTPYQPEVSQGTLQAMYEYQSMVCELTGMDVANASMYDGATAFAEGALMACRLTKRSRVVCSPTVHPHWRETLQTYAEAGTLEIAEYPAVDPDTGRLVIEGQADGVHGLAEALRAGDVAAVLVSSPDFFGHLHDVAELARVAHDAGALLVVGVNPVLLGVLEPPGACGADIVVGEGQPLGNSMSFGGPGLGLFACREAHMRQMPGRISGRTLDVDGNEAFVLTLATREQHIRREKATSNICSNHALNALAASVYLAAVGSEGLADTARVCMSKSRYLRDQLVATGRFSPVWDTPFGYEFALSYGGDRARLSSAMLDRGYLAGVAVREVASGWSFGLDPGVVDDLVLFAVTERRTREEMDAFVREVSSL